MSHYVEISNADYHASPAISASWLKLLTRSPRHLWHAYINPDRKPSEQTLAMQLGSLTHTLILEPSLLDVEYAIVTEGIDKRSKDGKALFAEIEASGRTAVKESDYKQCLAYANALLSNEDFIELRRDVVALNEKTFHWDDSETGLACKMRPDTLIAPCDRYPFGVITDVKTAADASPETFGRQLFNLGYHIQAAHNAAGLMEIYGTKEPPKFVFEVVEKEEPYMTQCYTVPDDVLLYGFEERARLMDIAADCFQRNEWPGYDKELIVPAWIRREMEDVGEIEVAYV